MTKITIKMEETANFTTEDRKTLTKVETKLDRAIEDISKLSSNFATKEELSTLDKRLTPTEISVEGLKTRMWFAMGGLAIISALVIPLIVYVFNTRTLSSDTITKSVVEAINHYNLTLDK